jgi:hypothetical protein
MGQPAYFQVLTNNASGVAADFSNANEVLMTTATGLLGFEYFTASASLAVIGSNANQGSPSWQLDFPCFQALGTAATSDVYNMPLFSHGKFTVGIKPSGEIDGGFTIASRATSSQNGIYLDKGNFRGRTWYSNGTWTMANNGAAWTLYAGSEPGGSLDWEANATGSYPWDPSWSEGTVTKNSSAGSYALKGDTYMDIPNGNGGVDKYHTSGSFGTMSSSTRLTFMFTTPTGGMRATYGAEFPLANGTSRRIFAGNVGIINGSAGGYNGGSFSSYGLTKGGGYVGAVGLPPADMPSAKRNFGSLFKNGRLMSEAHVTGAEVSQLDPYLVNADANVASSTPSQQPIYFFHTGGDAQFLGTLSRRDNDFKNLLTSENNAVMTFTRRYQSAVDAQTDSVTPSDCPNLSNFSYMRRFQYGYDSTPTNAISFRTNGLSNMWGQPSETVGFLSGADLRLYGSKPGDWTVIDSNPHLCGDPHITPLFGDRYDL